MRIRFMHGSHVFLTCCRAVYFFWITAVMTACPVFADPVNDAISCNLSEPAPVVQGNVLFSVFSEIPAAYGEKKISRGHVTAIRMYDPVDPGRTEKAELWDAGHVLNRTSPNERKIFFPQMNVTRMSDVMIATGDGNAKTFSGTLKGPVVATTVSLTDQHETFCDVHPSGLKGDFGGKGILDHFKGILTVTFNEPPADGVPIQCSYAFYSVGSALVSFNNSNVNNIDLVLDDTHMIPDRYLYDLDGDGTVSESDGDWLVQWVRGFRDGACIKKDWLLGTVHHSVPALAVPPGRPHWYYGTQVTETERNGYDAFVAVNHDRRTVLYAGSQDGMIHAFDSGKFCRHDNPETVVVENRGYFEWQVLGDDLSLSRHWNQMLARYPVTPPDFRWQGIKDGDKAPDYGTGEELWAFIPPNLLPKLKNNLLNAAGRACMDVSPTIADVYTRGAWRTVLLSAEGNGGATVFCLDITEPDKPIFLWEFSDPGISTGPRFQAAPAIGRIALEGKKGWATFLGSGKPNDPALDPSIYLIDIADGSLIRRVFLHAGMDADGDHMDDGAGGVPVGQPAVIDTDGNGYVDRMYVGTNKGFVFKVNVSDDPEVPGDTIRQCVINTDFYYEDRDGYTRFVPPDRQYQSLNHSPAVAVDHHANESGETEYTVSIFFGTGDSPYDNDHIDTADAVFSLFSYKDGNTKGECRSDRVILDWHKALPQGHRAFAAPYVAAGTVYFGTSTRDAADPCGQDGRGRIYGLNMEDGEVIHEEEVGNIMTSLLVEDEHLYIKTNLFKGKNPLTMGGGRYNNQVIMGADARNGIRAWKEIR